MDTNVFNLADYRKEKHKKAAETPDVSGKKKPKADQEPNVWGCPCGSTRFVLYLDGHIRCHNCREVVIGLRNVFDDDGL